MQGDALLHVTSTAICGSDLHMYTNFMVRNHVSYPCAVAAHGYTLTLSLLCSRG